MPERLIGSMIMEAAAVASCVAGRDDACTTALLDPRAFARVPARVVADERRHISSAYPWAQDDYPGNVLAALRQSLGASAFERLWTAELPPDKAYAAITGEPFARFARPYLQHYLPVHRAGPLHADLSLALGLGLGLALAWWAIRGTRRARS